jgi:hypothetical protein
MIAVVVVALVADVAVGSSPAPIVVKRISDGQFVGAHLRRHIPWFSEVSGGSLDTHLAGRD